ncbi:MAG: type III-B CRISPR module RAMP protein Cmr6 [Deltaproteobacteria bacterium]|nr:type III-B CRISPR module RAMP protein Cmr6 [Deltaproteobacteria bacterium]
MTFYPFHKDLRALADSNSFSSGNFGLWYNQLIPNIGQADKDAWCSCDNKNNKDKRSEFYKNIYDKIQKNKNIETLLVKKHCLQMHYMNCMEQQDFHCLTFTGILKSPMITGLGETHPTETSIVLDHTLGIPYIPASGIKGLIRFSHSKQLLFDDNGDFTDKFVEKGSLNETDKDTHIPLFFGGTIKDKIHKITDTLRGSIFFLDAYSVNTPQIKADIINPHYSDYYGDKNKPPGDYQDPLPVKFLTIAPGAQFVFRFMLDSKSAKHKVQLSTAVKNALEQEGFGAKTATGYGRFKISEGIPAILETHFNKYFGDQLTDKAKKEREINKFIERVNKLEKADISIVASGMVESLFAEWRNFKNDDDKKFMADHIGIANAFEAKIKKEKRGGFTKYYEIICKIIGNQPKGEPKPISPPISEKQLNSKIIGKLQNIIKRGFCLKKEKKKILKKHKKNYPDLCSNIKRLPEKISKTL